MIVPFNRHIRFWGTATLFFLLLSQSAHAQKDKCLEGNCKNGQGLRRVTDKAGNHFYEMGDFRSGGFTGKGIKVAAQWNAYGNYKTIEDTLTAAFNNGMQLQPALYKYNWFEKGNFENGVLNGQGARITYRDGNSSTDIYSEGEFKNGLLQGKAIKKITKEGTFFTYDSIAKKTVTIPSPVIMYSGIFEKGFCADCIRTDVGLVNYGATVMNMYGKGIDRDLITGWVIKDYKAVEGQTWRSKNVPAYRALYIGGFEIATLPGTQLSAGTEKVDLGNGSIYTGEIDEKKQPFGFGKIEYPGPYGITYEGMVDNGKPHGYGYFYAARNDFATITGGLYKHGKIMYGASMKAGVEVLRFGTNWENTADPEFREDLFRVLQGSYTHYYFSYDNIRKKWNLTREESGFNVNGFSKNTWVAKGQTDAEKRKQRVVTAGAIAISDLLVGDIIVLDGFASPVVSEAAGIFTLKNGKKVAAISGINRVQLSRYSSTDFFISCGQCNGSGQISYNYQRPPEQVNEFYYVTETIIGEFTILTHPVLKQHQVTKTYPPVKRTANCTVCSSAGFTKNITQIKEQ